jgi:molybdate transport system substrate-binding protein
MTQVRDRFLAPLDLSETDMVVIVQPGNPKGVRSVGDLAQADLKLGIANEEQSALGALTRRLFQTIPAGEMNLYEAIQPNVKVRTPTADLLVNQLRTGALDAAVVYQANVSLLADKLEVIPIREGNPTAVQPIAVGNESRHKYLMGRLVDALKSAKSRTQFETHGFRWHARAGAR